MITSIKRKLKGMYLNVKLTAMVMWISILSGLIKMDSGSKKQQLPDNPDIGINQLAIDIRNTNIKLIENGRKQMH